MASKEYLRKPEWLKIKLNTNESYTDLKKMMRKIAFTLYVRKLNVLTSMNVGQLEKTATFMIMAVFVHVAAVFVQ